MLNKFRMWYLKNQVQITWFVVGWLSLAFMVDFINGNWLGCVIDAALIWANLALNR